MCIKVLGGAKRRYASVGDTIVVSVKEAIPRGRVKKGDVLRAVVVRTAKDIQRKDGDGLGPFGLPTPKNIRGKEGGLILFARAAGVIDNKPNEPIGTRIFGPV